MSVRYEVDGRVATFTLDRPEQRNAVDPDLAKELGEAVAAFEADPEVWVGILTGAGPNFCAGADLKALAAGRGAELSTERGRVRRLGALPADQAGDRGRAPASRSPAAPSWCSPATSSWPRPTARSACRR